MLCEHESAYVWHPLFYVLTGIVTRCPLELKMIRTKDEESWHGRISYRNEEKDIAKPEDVEKMIREGRNM